MKWNVHDTDTIWVFVVFFSIGVWAIGLYALCELTRKFFTHRRRKRYGLLISTESLVNKINPGQTLEVTEAHSIAGTTHVVVHHHESTPQKIELYNLRGIDKFPAEIVPGTYNLKVMMNLGSGEINRELILISVRHTYSVKTDQVNLDGVGSDEGLLDLTQESSVASLGAELLDPMEQQDANADSKFYRP
jgi:hypothetical protein